MNILGFSESYNLCLNSSTLPLYHQSSHRQYVNELVWFREILFPESEFAYTDRNALLGMERYSVIKEGVGKDVLSRIQSVTASIC